MATGTTERESRTVGGGAARSRLSGWAGIAFLPFFVAGAFLSTASPDSKDSDAKWLSWYADSGHRTTVIVGMYLLIAAAVLLMTFVAGLHERLSAGRAAMPTAYRLIAWFGIAAVASILVGAVSFAGTAGNITFGDMPAPHTADVLRQNIGFPFVFVAGAICAAVSIVASATVAGRAGVFRPWLVRTSYVLAVVLLGAVVFVPMVALPIWTLTVGIVLLRSSPA